jgi:hypothetical protein
MYGEYLLKVEDSDTFLYISQNHNSYTLHIFTNGKYIIDNCIEFTRYRDGGSTYIKTANGNILKLPNSMENRKFDRENWTYNNHKVISLDENLHNVNLKILNTHNIPLSLHNLIIKDIASMVETSSIKRYMT